MSGSHDKTVRVWEADGTPGPILCGHESFVNSVAMSADGLCIVSGSSDRTVRVWGADGTPGHDDKVNGVAMSADGQCMVSGSGDKTVRMWGADGAPGLTIRDYRDIVSSVAISADGLRMA